MASLRGGQTLWQAATVANVAVSPLVEIGPGPFVAVYIENTGAVAATFQIEASATAAAQAGRNALSSAADGGLPWFNYQDKDGTNLSIAVAAGAAVCVDLSPFAPQFLRLVRTDSNGNTTITALVSAFGPN